MRECLGCETYAKYTHTRVPSCAHFMFASASVRPSVFRFSVLLENATLRARGSRLLPARSRAFFMWPAAQRGSARRHPRRHVADVVASVRNVSTFTACYASPSLCAIYRACAPINGEPPCQIVIWTVPLQAEKMTRSFSLVLIGLRRREKASPRGNLNLLLLSYLNYQFWHFLFIAWIKCAMSLQKWARERKGERKEGELLCLSETSSTHSIHSACDKQGKKRSQDRLQYYSW